ncbi:MULTISPECIES: hypothetical protein [Cysteiniphilum]|uniref:hypothetical protein n=1 Tax=Cysteiniphilum TaxID=2056696 RepID=UPI00177E59CF|nr:MULTISPECIES: hypothetical protein [Cysteiniphilum]
MAESKNSDDLKKALMNRYAALHKHDIPEESDDDSEDDLEDAGEFDDHDTNSASQSQNNVVNTSKRLEEVGSDRKNSPQTETGRVGTPPVPQVPVPQVPKSARSILENNNQILIDQSTDSILIDEVIKDLAALKAIGDSEKGLSEAEIRLGRVQILQDKYIRDQKNQKYLDILRTMRIEAFQKSLDESSSIIQEQNGLDEPDGGSEKQSNREALIPLDEKLVQPDKYKESSDDVLEHLNKTVMGSNNQKEIDTNAIGGKKVMSGGDLDNINATLREIDKNNYQNISQRNDDISEGVRQGIKDKLQTIINSKDSDNAQATSQFFNKVNIDQQLYGIDFKNLKKASLNQQEKALGIENPHLKAQKEIIAVIESRGQDDKNLKGGMIADIKAHLEWGAFNKDEFLGYVHKLCENTGNLTGSTTAKLLANQLTDNKTMRSYILGQRENANNHVSQRDIRDALSKSNNSFNQYQAEKSETYFKVPDLTGKLNEVEKQSLILNMLGDNYHDKKGLKTGMLEAMKDHLNKHGEIKPDEFKQGLKKLCENTGMFTGSSTAETLAGNLSKDGESSKMLREYLGVQKEYEEYGRVRQRDLRGVLHGKDKAEGFNHNKSESNKNDYFVFKTQVESSESSVQPS